MPFLSNGCVVWALVALLSHCDAPFDYFGHILLAFAHSAPLMDRAGRPGGNWRFTNGPKMESHFSTATQNTGSECPNQIVQMAANRHPVEIRILASYIRYSSLGIWIAGLKSFFNQSSKFGVLRDRNQISEDGFRDFKCWNLDLGTGNRVLMP